MTTQHKRAEKQRRRQRRQEHRRQSWQQREQPGYEELSTESRVEQIAVAVAMGGELTDEVMAYLHALPGVGAALDRLVARHGERIRAEGWDPPLARHCVRRLGARHAARLLDGVACDLRTGVELVVFLVGLPVLAVAREDRLAPADARLLDRVRALLAKAESTEFTQEAEALTAKAQELISRHSLERLLATDAGREHPSVRHCPLDDPYADAKAMLLAAVAGANRCQAVYRSGLSFSTVVGFDTDLRATEALFTSLLVQAVRTMTSAGREGAGARRPSYRRSFLVAYSHRIGERLEAARAQASATVTDQRLLPVLARRGQAVTDAVEDSFGELVSEAVSATNGYGWAAGRWAADQAELFTAEQLRAG